MNGNSIIIIISIIIRVNSDKKGAHVLIKPVKPLIKKAVTFTAS